MTSFELNSKIELTDSNGDIVSGLIYDYVDNKLYVSTTSHEKDLKLLHVGDFVTGVFVVGTKGKYFDGVISDRIPGEILIYEISDISNIQTFQRREDVRVDLSLPAYLTDDNYYLNLKKHALENYINEIKAACKKTTILDLSAGGMKLSVNSRLEVGQVLLLLFYIDEKPLILKGELLHERVRISNNTRHYNYGVKFLDITELERETIISYVFVVMRKNRIR